MEQGEYKDSWLDAWWPVLVIAFGTAFILINTLWHPTATY